MAYLLNKHWSILWHKHTHTCTCMYRLIHKSATHHKLCDKTWFSYSPISHYHQLQCLTVDNQNRSWEYKHGLDLAVYSCWCSPVYTYMYMYVRTCTSQFNMQAACVFRNNDTWLNSWWQKSHKYILPCAYLTTTSYISQTNRFHMVYVWPRFIV